MTHIDIKFDAYYCKIYSNNLKKLLCISIISLVCIKLSFFAEHIRKSTQYYYLYMQYEFSI